MLKNKVFDPIIGKPSFDKFTIYLKRDPTTPIQSLISQIQKAQDLVEAASDPFEENILYA